MLHIDVTQLSFFAFFKIRESPLITAQEIDL
jgi:hypothetical protein